MKDLLTSLEEYSNSNTYPMHMPGHKRGNLISMPNPFNIDITEIDSFDNLHSATGILRNGMHKTARLFGAKQSFHLIGGSTAGILSTILALTSSGDEIIIARNCHKAVYNAAILGNLFPIYIMPEFNENFNISGVITPESVKIALDKNPNAKLVVVTSPTYEGVVSDIKKIADICNSKNIPLFVDEAHGAHLGFHESFPQSSVSLGADVVVQSLHKTLPSLTQTAILHICSDKINADKIQQKLAILQTSSPSYVLLASIERCVSLLEEKGKQLFNDWHQNLINFSQQMKALKNFKLLDSSNSDFFDFDMSKIVISTRGTNFSGNHLSNFLRNNHQIEIEMASANYIVAMTSVADTPEAFERLANAIIDADNMAVPCSENDLLLPPICETAMPISKAANTVGKLFSLDNCANKISCDFVYAYPPGIPIIAPGEKISTEIIHYVDKLKSAGVNVLPDEINCM